LLQGKYYQHVLQPLERLVDALDDHHHQTL
jgi:hypothetical protein